MRITGPGGIPVDPCTTFTGGGLTGPTQPSRVVLGDGVSGETTTESDGTKTVTLTAAGGPSGATSAAEGTLGPWGASQYDAGATGGNFQWMSPDAQGDPLASSVADARQVFATKAVRDGTVTAINCSLAQTWIQPIVFTLRKNGVASALTCTVAAGQTYGTALGSISFAAGDELHVTMACPESGLNLWAKATLAVTWAEGQSWGWHESTAAFAGIGVGSDDVTIFSEPTYPRPAADEVLEVEYEVALFDATNTFARGSFFVRSDEYKDPTLGGISATHANPRVHTFVDNIDGAYLTVTQDPSSNTAVRARTRYRIWDRPAS